MEEKFFFQYHMKMAWYGGADKYPIFERKWLIERFMEQRNKENEELEKSKKKQDQMSRNIWLKRKRKGEIKKIVKDAIDKHKTKDKKKDGS